MINFSAESNAGTTNWHEFRDPDFAEWNPSRREHPDRVFWMAALKITDFDEKIENKDDWRTGYFSRILTRKKHPYSVED